MHVGRKFIAFVLCLITFIVMGIVGRGEGMAPYIVGLFVAYTTGNVAQKATSKSESAKDDSDGTKDDSTKGEGAAE